MRTGLIAVGLFVLALALAGCEQRAPAPTRQVPQAGATIGATLAGDPVEGAALWREKQCVACHGATALGGIGKPLANTPLTFAAYLDRIRNAMPPKPAMNAADLSDAQASSIYAWLHQLPVEATKATPVPPSTLPSGQMLGIQLWTQKGCSDCHGAFAQGSVKAPALAGESFPFERQRAVMRLSADVNPVHSAQNIPDDVLQRLLDWLRRGADPAAGC